MKISKEYHIGFQEQYHHEFSLFPEYAPFWSKFQILLGRPLLVYLALSYVCFLFGGSRFLDVYGFVRFLMDPELLFYLFPFAFIWIAMFMIYLGKRIAADYEGQPIQSNGAWILYFMASIFMFGGIIILFALHYAY